MPKDVIVVTGGSRGIGHATCRLLAKQGAAVAVCFHREEKAAQATVEVIVNSGGIALPFQLSLETPRKLPKIYSNIEQELGPITGLVANAGVLGAQRKVSELKGPELKALFAVNTIGPMLCVKEAIKRMSTSRGGNGGAIVMVSSVAARLGGSHGMTGYAASKGAIETFVRGAALEVSKEDIRINAVAPGITDTDMPPSRIRTQASHTVPMGRVAEPREVAAAIGWLLSTESSYLTGTVVPVSGGR